MKCEWKHAYCFPLQHKKSKAKLEPAGKANEQKVHLQYSSPEEECKLESSDLYISIELSLQKAVVLAT